MKRPSAPECIERSYSNKEAERFALHAWRSLALAGAPRCPKSEREKHVAAAWRCFDQARAHVIEARYFFCRLTGKVEAAEAERRAGRQQHTSSFSGETYYHDPPGAKAHEKAGVTSLRPVVTSLSRDLQQLGDCLRRFRGGATARPGYPDHSEEIAAANRRQSVFSHTAPFRHCHWCGQVEEKYREHHGLDGEGYAVRRKDAVRFCCSSCFRDGKDLAVPHPKPIDPSVETVPSRVEAPPALPPHAAALSADEHPLGSTSPESPTSDPPAAGDSPERLTPEDPAP